MTMSKDGSMAAPGAVRNLILVHRAGSQDIEDFRRIRDLITDRAPDIEVFIASTGSPCAVTRRRASRRPTLVFSPTPLFKFEPARGRIYCGQTMSKAEQIRLLKAAGIPIPETVVLERYTRLDPTTWGEFTILKPDLGSVGIGVSLERTKDVLWIDPFSRPENDSRHGVLMLAQKFVDATDQSGRQYEYRVLTLFARPLYSLMGATELPRQSMAEIVDEFGGKIAFNRKGLKRELRLVAEGDVLDLARRAAQALGEVPCLGLDIVRERSTGQLYVLEANPGGNIWHLSSIFTPYYPQAVREGIYTQFAALETAAEALIAKTREEAC